MQNIDYTIITTSEGLREFYDAHQSIDWIGFDTEFISEKRYFPQLCLIQVASEHGCFLIDTLVLEDISLFLEIIQNPNILKITHAGANDYRLFFQLYQVMPQHTYDVQVAAGFMGYHYPVALNTLLSEEINIRIDKSQKVSDWAERPMKEEQIKYALIDVLYLKELADVTTQKLKDFNRFEDATEEMKAQLEDVTNYEEDPTKNILKSSSLLKLTRKNQLFYLRLNIWREAEAKRQNVSRSAILDNKMMIFLTKNIQSGIKKLQANRRAPKHLVYKRAELLEQFYSEQPTAEEAELLQKLPKQIKNQFEMNLLFDQVDLYIQYVGKQSNIDASLILPRSELNKMKVDKNYTPRMLQTGWRKKLLDAECIEWLFQRKPITMGFEGGVLSVRTLDEK